MSAADAARRNEAGVDRVMWGSDYPHTEATWPDSRGAIATAVADVPDEDARRMLGLNAVDFYRFDLPTVRDAAARIGPTTAEVFGVGS